MNTSSLNIVHFNPDGIRGRQTDILNYINQENTHIIAVSETHLKPNQHFSLGNFFPIRKDRAERQKGGVAFFINNRIELTINDWFNKYPNLEALSIKISPSEVTRAPIDLVVYYNPPPKVINQRLFEIVNRNSNNAVKDLSTTGDKPRPPWLLLRPPTLLVNKYGHCKMFWGDAVHYHWWYGGLYLTLTIFNVKMTEICCQLQ